MVETLLKFRPVPCCIESSDMLKFLGHEQLASKRQREKAGSKFNSIKAKKYDDNDGASANRRCPHCWARSRSQTDAVWQSSLSRCEQTFQPGSHRLHEAAKPSND